MFNLYILYCVQSFSLESKIQLILSQKKQTAGGQLILMTLPQESTNLFIRGCNFEDQSLHFGKIQPRFSITYSQVIWH